MGGLLRGESVTLMLGLVVSIILVSNLSYIYKCKILGASVLTNWHTTPVRFVEIC